MTSPDKRTPNARDAIIQRRKEFDSEFAYHAHFVDPL